MALAVHSAHEPFALWPEEDFINWLHEHYGTSSSLTWAAEIERHTPADSTPVDEFFRLLDHFRRDITRKPASHGTWDRLPGIEYMSNTFVTLFRRRRLLAEAVRRLENRGFRVVHLEAHAWATERDMHQAVAAALQFPDYYGHNLDALNDCLGDVACFGSHEETAEGIGLVLSLTDYDRFAAASPRAAQIVLDIIAVGFIHESWFWHRFRAAVTERCEPGGGCLAGQYWI